MPETADVLAGWTSAPFSAAGLTYEVFTREPGSGPGPGVVLLPEIPGMTPAVMGLADHLVGAGFTVAVPSLFGEPGRAASAGYGLGTFAKACITREFAAFARRADRPIAEYVRALARHLHERVGGPGVGVIGMCFTGGFALAAAVEPAVLAPVASQPALPLPLGAARRRDIGMSEREEAAVAQRVRSEGLCLVGLRFTEDAMVRRRALRRPRGCVRAGLAGDPHRLERGQSAPDRQAGALGAHQRRCREARAPDERRPRRGDRLPARAADRRIALRIVGGRR